MKRWFEWFVGRGKRPFFLRTSTVLALLAAAGAARADVKIVVAVTADGALQRKAAKPATATQPAGAQAAGVPAAGVPAATVAAAPSDPGGLTPVGASAANETLTWITYFKGRKARRESENGYIVTLYDKEAGKVFTLDTHAKTYYITPYKDAFKNGAGLPDNLASRIELDSSVDIDPASTQTDLTRAILGRTAKKFSLFGDEVAESKAPAQNQRSGRGGGGRRGGGGGFPGGGFPFAGQPSDANLDSGAAVQNRGASLPHTSMSGETWLVDADQVLPGVKKDERDLSIALLSTILPGHSLVLGPLADELSKKSMLPLASHIRLRLFNAEPPTTEDETENPAFPALVSEPLSLNSETTLIDSTVNLDDRLFQVPDGYDRIDPPAPVLPLPLQSAPGGPGSNRS